VRRRFWLLIGAVAALTVVLGGGAAFAYFTSSGNGSGSGSTGTMQPVTVTALVGGDAPSTKLLPGQSADVILRVNNPNAYAVTLVSVTGGPGAITASGGIGICTTTGVTFNNQIGLGKTINPSGTTFVDLANAASMNATSQTGCQGATFSMPVSITVHLG
jgi:hypothetical protein